MASRKRGRKKVSLESQLNKITGYLAPTSSSDATAIVHNILEQLLERCDEPQYIVNTIVDDLLQKVGGTETDSKHAGDKVSDRTVRSWTAKYPWLIVEKEGNERKMLCSVCKSAQQRLKLTTVWATEGTPNIQHSSIFRHKTSNEHKAACADNEKQQALLSAQEKDDTPIIVGTISAEDRIYLIQCTILQRNKSHQRR